MSFESEIAALEAKFRDATPGNVVFYGSSSIRLWPGLAREFPDVKIENFGFGGAQLSDCARFFERLLQSRSPRALVFYAGDNDLAHGASAADVWESLAALLDASERLFGPLPFAFLSLKPSPARAELRPLIEETNEWCRREIAGRPNATWVEVFEPMLGENGQPRRELFLSDQLHLSRAGYDLWNTVLRRDFPFLEAPGP